MFRRLFRRRPAPVPWAPRVAIAVMEYEELGIEPEPGSLAALAIGLRSLAKAGTCVEHDPIAPRPGDIRTIAVCSRCAQPMEQDRHGVWRPI